MRDKLHQEGGGWVEEVASKALTVEGGYFFTDDEGGRIATSGRVMEINGRRVVRKCMAKGIDPLFRSLQQCCSFLLDWLTQILDLLKG